MMPSSERSGLQRFIWWVSCTDPEAVTLCSPVTQFYQTTAGVMILITGILAFFSGSYAISQVVRFVPIALLLGAIYAIAIVSIDRFIVSARGNRIAVFRLPLAVLIGCIVAVPLELRLLEDRINKELHQLERGENEGAEERRQGQRDALRARITELEQSAANYRNKIAEWGAATEAEVVGRVRAGRTGRAGEGPAYRAAQEQKQLNTELLQRVSIELERLRQQESTLLEQIDKEYQRAHISQAYDLLARYEAMHAVEREHPEAAKMTWAITLVLILIELFPALVKMTMPYTAYGALVEAREREDIQRVHSLGNHHLRDLVSDPYDPQLFVMHRTAAIKQMAEDQLPWKEQQQTEKRRAAGA